MSAIFEHQTNATKISEVKALVLDHDLIKFGSLVYRHSGIVKIQFELMKLPKTKAKPVSQGQSWWLLLLTFPFVGVILSGGYIDFASTWNNSVMGWLFIVALILIVLSFFRAPPAPPPKKKPKEEARLHIHLSAGDKFVVTAPLKVIVLMQTHIEQFMTGTSQHNYVAIDAKTGVVKIK